MSVTVALTSLSHGAGCGCKLPAAELHPIVAALPRSSRTTAASSAVSNPTSTSTPFLLRGSDATIGCSAAAGSLQPQPAPWERVVSGTVTRL